MATIFCDTDCELWYTKAREYDIKVIRMPYIVDGKEILCDLGEETDHKAFFDEMRRGAVVSTAGLNQEIYYNYFKPYFEKGEDILYVAFGSRLSNTFEYLELALNRLNTEYPGVKFRRFDTMNICMGAGMLVYLAAKFFRENGDDVDKTYEYLETIVNRVKVYFLVEDMKYLARGGRISPAKAAIGNMLKIKPVLTIKNGVVDVDSKQMGLVKANKYIFDNFVEKYAPFDDAPVVIVDADNKPAADALEQKIKEVKPDAIIWRQPIGPVIGCHAGPGALGLIFPIEG